MLKSISISPVVRAVLVIGGVAALVTGVTFAALDSSSASLTGNTVASATAELTVSTDNSVFGASRPGFSFADVVPGGDPAPAAGKEFWLKNTGAVTLALTATVPTLPTPVPADLDYSKVHVIVTDPGADGLLDGTNDTQVLDTTMSALGAGEVPLAGTLAPAPPNKKFFVQVSMDPGTFSGTNATIGAFSLVFNGTNAAETI